MKHMGRVGLVLGVLALSGMTGCKNEQEEQANSHRIAGTNFLADKKYAEAIKEYELSLQANPNQEKVWEKKAFAHLQAGDPAAAATSALKLLEFRKEPAQKAEVYRNIAGFYMQGGPLEKAEEYFNEALKIDPKDEASLGWIAEIYSQKGGARSMTAPLVPEHLDKALQYYDKVLAVNPNSANTYLNKRIVMLKYIQYETDQKDAALSEAAENAKDAAIVAEAKARADQHQARVEEFKKQFDEVNKKFGDLAKAAKGQAAAKP
ncbi:hypothetical protein JGU66_17115 [Myxococcaceae bacterium JPH2]|nr:hypothetical protein [Myxococcaceae bacterium JPH2]